MQLVRLITHFHLLRDDDDGGGDEDHYDDDDGGGGGDDHADDDDDDDGDPHLVRLNAFLHLLQEVCSRQSNH